MSEPVGTFKTGNTTWKVYVLGKRFQAVAAGFSDVTGDTWDAMENGARVAASKAKVKVDVPYVFFTRGGWRHGGSPLSVVRRTATGINSGTGNVSYRDAGGTPGQETASFNRRDFMKPFSAADEAAYIMLKEQILSLEKQASAIESRYEFKGSLKEEVQRAIDEKHAEMEAGSHE